MYVKVVEVSKYVVFSVVGGGFEGEDKWRILCYYYWVVLFVLGYEEWCGIF